MSFRTWLLTGTSLGLLALAPIGVARAQDAALVAAYQAYASAQASGDAAAIETAQAALQAECIVAGFASLEDCIAALSAQTTVTDTPPAEEPAPPAEEPAPAPAEEPAPAPAEEPAPAPAEEPAPPPADPVEEPAPAEQPAAPAEAPADPVQEPAPAEQPAAPAAETPSEAAPAAEEPAPAADPNADVVLQLEAAVALYNEGLAELDAGNVEGQAKVDQALATIQTICTTAGYTDTAQCLATFGFELAPLPPAGGTPATEETPIEELPGADQPVTEEATEALPPEIPPEEAAPVLDSAKDQQTEAGAGEQPPAEPAAPEEPAAPPPADDAQAQADIQPPPPEEQSTQTEQGERIDVQEIVIAPPEGNDQVQIIEQNNRGNGFIFQIGINIYINNPEQERDRYYDEDEDEIYYEQLSRGRVRETIVRPNGVKIVTVRNRNGDILKRSKILPDGREIILASVDDRDSEFILEWRDPGEELPPLRLTIPISEYILDADSADEEEIEFFLDQPPVEKVRRIYSIDEVKRSARVRDSVRRLEVGGLTFDSGKATISRDQVGSLAKVANAMLKLLDRNPGEVFLIEGHTDAVGSDESNLVLSDQRAATVARILTDFYEIPAENLVTQGYGERYLKVETEDAEELNRRVTIKDITPLVSYQS